MKEIELILKTIPKLNPGEKAIVATVVDVQGSAYRGEGAKMLIRANGDAVGTVSGGCLEADVLERAKQVADSGKAQVFTYDTTKNEDSVFSLNMGCRGVIRILFEPLDHDYFDRLSRRAADASGSSTRLSLKVTISVPGPISATATTATDRMLTVTGSLRSSIRRRRFSSSEPGPTRSPFARSRRRSDGSSPSSTIGRRSHPATDFPMPIRSAYCILTLTRASFTSTITRSRSS